MVITVKLHWNSCVLIFVVCWEIVFSWMRKYVDPFYIQYIYIYITCIKRSPLGKRKKWPYKTGVLLKEVQFIWIFLWQDMKRWPFNTGDCLIEVTAWADVTVYIGWQIFVELILKSEIPQNWYTTNNKELTVLSKWVFTWSIEHLVLYVISYHF